MGLTAILAATGLNMAARFLFRGRGREWYLFVVSLIAVFLLQPELPVRWLDFWLPVASCGLALAGWALTSEAEQRRDSQNWISAGAAGGIILLLGAARLLGLDRSLILISPPPLEQVVIGLAGLGLVFFGLLRVRSIPAGVLLAALVGLVAVFIVIKTPALALLASLTLRSAVGQGSAHANGLDIRWLGYSYLAFRLIHTLRDRQSGRQHGASLREYVVYALFFPALPAGPIDRLERFLKDLRSPMGTLSEDWSEGGRRLLVGLFKKFVLADGLAIVALNAQNAPQVHGAGWGWILLYAYALQIYFDFAGYTDVAIGLGRLVGIQLPENFHHPYWNSSLTTFWNNWHITLTMWFRGYVFNPLVRAMRRGRKLGPAAILLLAQLATMGLIGLWHGVAWTFVIWGLWHGLGLFVQNRWSEWIAPKAAALDAHPHIQRLVRVGGGLLTFHYVALGWVWFALPDPLTAVRFFGTLVGR